MINNDTIDRRSRLDMVLGKPKTPEEVAGRMVDLARGTGRTFELIRALPEDGKAIIVVWAISNAKRYFESMIRDIRGPKYPVKNLHFVSCEQMRKDTHRLRGVQRPVFVDNAVLDMLSIRWVQDINSMFNPKDERGRTKDEEEAFWKEVAKMARTLPRDWMY